MLDRFNREIDYLRISVTDRCNHRCFYCVPDGWGGHADHKDILSYEQIEAITREAVTLGFKKVRLTGGEPLFRDHIEVLVKMLSDIAGIQELCMTTNGYHLPELADKLAANGLNRITISIDSLDPERYRKITRGGKLGDALLAVDAARRAGLTPIKINMIILEDTTEKDIQDMQEYCDRNEVTLQKIMQFSLYDRDDLCTRIQTERPPPCHHCNRLRLMADGFFKPCLFSDEEIKVDFSDLRGSIERAILGKPQSGSTCRNRTMCAIGG